MLETRNQPSRGSAIFSNHAQGRGCAPQRAKLYLFTRLNVQPLVGPGYRSVGKDNGIVFWHGGVLGILVYPHSHQGPDFLVSREA